MNAAITEFIRAHEYCRVLERFALCTSTGLEHAALTQELQRAYEDLDRRTLAVTGIRFADGNQVN
jgi:hypothetical protein